MRCPVDGVDMNKAEREGIEIDYCPQCRGVWLHRGELDKIIDRALAEFQGGYGPGNNPYGPAGYRGGAGGPSGYGGPGGYPGGPEDQGYGEGPYGGGPGGQGGPPWEQGPGPGGGMSGPYGGPPEGGYGGPPQGERRPSIFDIFRF